MPRQSVELFLAIVLLASLAEGWLFSTKTKNWPVHAVGQVTCDGEPMPFVYVELMNDNLIFDTKMGQARASATGWFSVKGSGRHNSGGKPNPYIRVSYSYSGTYGKLKVVNILSIVRRGKTSTRSYNSYIDFNNINFASVHCEAYVQFYKALKHYNEIARSPLPYSVLHIETNAIIHGGTAYATTNVVRIPGKYKTVKYETAKHEFAHTIRHSFDGSLGHFLADVGRYVYMQHHHCGKKTNSGFAFNEGWAEYWAGSCKGNYGSPANNYSYEGNVAKALRALQAKCNSSLYRMVRVLRQKKNSIHSFNEFNNVHYSLYTCKL